MATPLLWMRLPDAGGLGLALNAAHEANVDGVPDADLIRRALSVAAEIWSGIGGIEDRAGVRAHRAAGAHARPHRGHPRRHDAARSLSARHRQPPATAAVARSTSVDEHRPLPGALRVAGQARERVGRVERARDVRDAGGDERRRSSPRRAAATETSGNENACRSPVRR